MKRYAFLVDTYQTERLKTLSVWATFRDEDLDRRPREGDRRGRTPREHMLHQFGSEEGWFRDMLGIDVGAETPPTGALSIDFIRAYARHSLERERALREKSDAWWEEKVGFFEVSRSRAWVLVRRIAHTAHHRGQQTALLRVWGSALHSTYGPTADTGGLPTHQAPTIYPYSSLDALLEFEARPSGMPLPGPGAAPVTELGQGS